MATCKDDEAHNRGEERRNAVDDPCLNREAGKRKDAKTLSGTERDGRP